MMALYFLRVLISRGRRASAVVAVPGSGRGKEEEEEKEEKEKKEEKEEALVITSSC